MKSFEEIHDISRELDQHNADQMSGPFCVNDEIDQGAVASAENDLAAAMREIFRSPLAWEAFRNAMDFHQYLKANLGKRDIVTAPNQATIDNLLARDAELRKAGA